MFYNVPVNPPNVATLEQPSIKANATHRIINTTTNANSDKPSPRKLRCYPMRILPLPRTHGPRERACVEVYFSFFGSELSVALSGRPAAGTAVWPLATAVGAALAPPKQEPAANLLGATTFSMSASSTFFTGGLFRHSHTAELHLKPEPNPTYNNNSQDR
jgi:hypothetical protein